MKIERHERVTRYDCVLDARETAALKAIGWLPPHASTEAPLTMTAEEIITTIALLYGEHRDARAAEICLSYEGPCFCGSHRSELQ